MSNQLKTLFIGKGHSAQAWYRCALPAIHLENAEWIGLIDIDDTRVDHPGFMLAGSLEDYPDFKDYDVLIVQQVKGENWKEFIKYWQAEGKTVIYECDDFIHGIYKIEDHRFKGDFSKKTRSEYELCMKQADSMICSTEFLSKQYEKYNPNQHVCLVSLDTERYNVQFGDKNMPVIGWAGGTGHNQAIGKWMRAIFSILERNPNVAFASIGTDYAGVLEPYYNQRTISIPWITIENYPSALTNFDLVIAPSHDSKYFKSKSDLRWLEASAVGLPVIAENSITYSDCYPATFVNSQEDIELEIEDWLSDPSELEESAKEAQEKVKNTRDIREGVQQWANAIVKSNK